MKRIWMLLSVFTIGIFVNSVSIAVNDTPTVHLVFNQVSYHSNDEMIMEIHVLNYNDLIGFQIDLGENFSFYTITNDEQPFDLYEDSIFSDFDTIWVNDVRNDIATFMVSRPLTEDFGYNYSNRSLLAQISLTATTTIEDVYSLFVVSNDYSDLQYGDANLIIKLSDTLGYSIAYDYVDIPLNVPKAYLNQGVDTIFLGESHTDNGITVDYDENYSIEVVSNIDVSIVGDYQIIYTINYGQGQLILVRNVYVRDAQPNIEFILNDAITTLFKGQTFVETGCSAIVNEVNMTCEVIGSNLDTSKVGEYYITYGIEVDGLIYQTRRYIMIIDPITQTTQMNEGGQL